MGERNANGIGVACEGNVAEDHRWRLSIHGLEEADRKKQEANALDSA